MKYDAIIVGARCAGAPTAMLLARKGYRVLLVDRGTFPSDTMSSHFIHSPGVSRLRKWGLLDRVARTNCPAVHSTSLNLPDFRLTGHPPPSHGVAEAYCVRRKYLDKVLVDAAAEAAAEVREGFTVEGLDQKDGFVTGIRGRTRAGTVVNESAQIIIGADGMHSIVARLVRAPEYNVVEPLTCNYYSYWSGLDLNCAELFPRAGRFFVAAPTNDGLTIINVLAPRSEFREFRSAIEGFFFRTLDSAPHFAERVRGGKREERFIGTADTPNYFRQAHGPGWALAGDAGYHRDAITAQGISDAFRDASLLAVALDAGFSGRAPFSKALSDYHRERDNAVAAMYNMTCQMARLAPPSPQQQALFEALRENQAEADRFFGTIAGTVPISGFFAEDNLERIIGACPVVN